ncbi:MAG TPA: hypothetical protein VKY41_06190 [Xanthomarina sp.]|nr:hypothetical protein [Xanthomarina sp.]
MSKNLSFSFGEITIHSCYMVVVMNEGITVTPQLNSVLEDLVETYYKNTNLVYITYRINSYSVDPKVYIKTAQISNVLGIAVVNGNESRLDNTDIEQMFYKKPFRTFDSLDNAVDWAKELCSIQ